MLRWDASGFLMVQAMDIRLVTRSRSGNQPHGRRICAAVFALIFHARSMARCGRRGGRETTPVKTIRDTPHRRSLDLNADLDGRFRPRHGRDADFLPAGL